MPANKRYKILSTKAIPAHLLETAAAGGIDITVQAFIDIRPVINASLAKRIAQLQDITAIFTSANAVHVVREHYPDTGRPDWKIYCLSGATREALDPQWQVQDTASNATDLAKAVIQHAESNVVFFCGNKRRGELPDLLRRQGIHVEELVVYETTETPAMAGEVFNGIFFLSPSAVSSFFSVNNLPPGTVCFCIGPTTAHALEAFTNNKIIVSAEPQLSELVQTAIFYFNNNSK